jgi:hypothetical protein
MGYDTSYYQPLPKHGGAPWQPDFLKEGDPSPDVLAPVDAASPHDQLPGLWESARMILCRLADMFGTPVDLTRQEYVPTKTHSLLGDWIRNLESLVRRILLVAAFALELPALTPRTAKGARGVGGFKRTWWDDPNTWQVSFRTFMPGNREQLTQVRGRGWRSPTKRTRRMAMRLEALRRAIRFRNDHIRRLARRLARIREHNRATNGSPRLVAVRPFYYRYEPKHRATARHAVARSQFIVEPLLAAAIDRWQPQEPG